MAYFPPHFYPLADIRRAILQRDSPSFAGCKELDAFPIRQRHFSQVKRDVYVSCLGLKKFSQLEHVLLLDTPAESEDRKALVPGSSNS